MTLILQSDEIKKIVHLNSELIPIIENAFESLSKGETVMPPILRLDIKKYHGESDVKAAYIEGLDSFAIKVASGFFNNPSLGLPSSNGLMILLDSKTGILKSVLLDKGYLTDVRTAIAGAIASKYLSNPEIETVGMRLFEADSWEASLKNLPEKECFSSSGINSGEIRLKPGNLWSNNSRSRKALAWLNEAGS